MAPHFAGNLRTPRVLSAIFEDEPPRHQSLNATQAYGNTHNRQSGQSFHWPFPFVPAKFSVSAPPSYSSEEIEGTEEDKRAHRLRNQKQIAKRGGWRRLIIIAIIIILCIVGLVVGLVVGLRHKKSSSNNDESSGNATDTAFPAGSYGIRTFLTSTDASCASNSAAWVCYPYTTYSESTSASSATFDWVINPINKSPNYTVSSTANVFSILFSDAIMSLRNRSTDSEHYFFSLNVPKSTKPRTPLTDENIQTTCYFNETRLQAMLYTRIGSSVMGSTFQAGATNMTVDGQTYVPWPYRVEVQQVSPSGGAVECEDANGNKVGNFGANNGDCSCQYGNNPD